VWRLGDVWNSDACYALRVVRVDDWWPYHSILISLALLVIYCGILQRRVGPAQGTFRGDVVVTHRCRVESSFGHPSADGLPAVDISYDVGF